MSPIAFAKCWEGSIVHIAFLNPQGNFDPKDSYWTEHPDFGGQLVYVKEVAIAMAGRAKVGTCNVDEQPKSSDRFRIRQIPTLVILKDNREVERFVGFQPETALMAAINKHIPCA